MEEPLSPNLADSFTLSDGRIMRVVTRHHASPAERWQMWKSMRATVKTFSHIGIRRRLNFEFLMMMNLLNPNCTACTYEIVDP